MGITDSEFRKRTCQHCCIDSTAAITIKVTKDKPRVRLTSI
jgi:hypothetical protein